MMGLGFVRSSFTSEDPGGPCRDALEVSQDSEAALSTLALKDGVLSNQSSDGQEPTEMFSMPSHFTHQDNNLDDQMELVVIEKSCSSKSFSSLEFKPSPMPSSPQLNPHLLRKFEGRPQIDPQMKVKKSWLSKLGAIAHVVKRHGEVGSKQSDYDSVLGERTKRVRVHPYNKHSKELSSLYCGQEFLAHEGSISTMKFSLDGQFLATAGEDCIVRIWKIIEDENLDGFNIQDLDSSCIYFRMNHLSQLTPLNMDKDHLDRIKKLGRLSDSTCVIFPPKVFQISEKPVHEFQGHCGEILALSWSTKGVKFLDFSYYLLDSDTKRFYS